MTLDKKRFYFYGFLLIVCAMVWSFPKTARAQKVLRGPYLQMGTSHSVIIVWRTDISTDARVQYGPTVGSTQKSVRSNTKKKQHELHITGLQPNTKYYYQVGTTKKSLIGGDAQHYFVTAPKIGQSKKFRFWVVGDSGTGGSKQLIVRDSMQKYTQNQKIDFFVHVGDMAYSDGKDHEFQNHFFNVYQDILRNTVVWPAMGNHEGYTSNSSKQTGPYYDAYVLPKAAEAGGVASGTEAYYSYDYGNVHFVVMDSYETSRKPSGAMLTWLKNDLAATRQPWLIAYWHHPPYTKGSHDSDTEYNLIDMRKYALPILEAHGVDLVLTGHSHIYERSYLIHKAYETPSFSKGKIKDKGDGRLHGSGPYKKAHRKAFDGAVYVVAGHGGAGVSQIGTHPLMYFVEQANGSCIVDVEGNKLTLRNLRHDGVVTDHFTIVKGKALVLSAPDGGEAFQFGSLQKIRWVTVGSIPKVRLSYSIDNGKTWKDIIASTSNTGSYDWRIPAERAQKGLVKISSVQEPSIQDQSDTPFKMEFSVPKQVISFGDTWKYHDRGIDFGTSWLALNFNDSSWKSGPGQLGYGEGDEKTKLYKGSSKRYPSVYFRKKIKISGKVSKAILTALHDDGIIIWVNGAKVFSEHVDKGDHYKAFASRSSDDNERSKAEISFPAKNPFVDGENIVAVMVKQISSTSSDISFDLDLILRIEPHSPTLQPIGSKQIQEKQALTIQVKASHKSKLPLVYSVHPLPKGASMSSKDGLFRWTPKVGQRGKYQLTFSVKDSIGQKASETVTVEVLKDPHGATAPEMPSHEDTSQENPQTHESVDASDHSANKHHPEENQGTASDSQTSENGVIVLLVDELPGQTNGKKGGCNCEIASVSTNLFLYLLMALVCVVLFFSRRL